MTSPTFTPHGEPSLNRLSLSAATIAAIHDHHPSWDVEQGLCPQCLDLYEARYGETSHVGCG
jgi:hypothetical protein